MADNENVWTLEIESEELAQLLTRAATSGHPEWDYTARSGLAKGSMSESDAVDYLNDCFNPKPPGDEGEEKPAPKRATAKG